MNGFELRLHSGPRVGLALLSLVGAASLAGCSIWRGELNEDHNRRVEARVRDISQTELTALSTRDLRSVDDELASVRERRDTDLPKPAPRVLDLSVDDLRLQTLRNNLDLDVVFVDPELADTVVSEEAAKFDATLFGSFNYKRSNPPRLDGDLVDFTSDDVDLDKKTVKLTKVEQTNEKLDFDFGIEVPLPTGGTVKLRNAFDEANKLTPERFEQYVAGVQFSLSQPLLRNAGVDANTASIRIARLGGQAVNAKTKLSAIRILAGAEKAYWRVYGAQKMLDVRIQQYKLAFDNLELVRKRVKEGLSADIEIVRAEVGVARRLETLIMAETSLWIQQRELKRILNLDDVPLESPTVIHATSPPQLLRYTLDDETLATAALENRMEMLELELQLAADAIRIDLARNQALPLFVIDFGYGILDRQGSFGTAWQGMWDFDNSALSVGVRGEIPVTNEAREAQLRRSMLGRVQRLATRAQRALAITQEVYDALDILDQNWQRILAARQNVIVSGINYEAELKQFREGLRTMREVLEVLSELGEAQIHEVNAIVAYQVAQIDLAFATGTLLGYAGLDLEPIPLAPEYGRAGGDLAPRPATGRVDQ